MGGKSRCDLRGPDALLLAKGEFLRCQAHLVPLQLRSLDDRQDGAEALVLHNRALVDAAVLVEGRVGKQLALAADLDSPVLPLEDADPLAAEAQSLGTWLDEIGDSLESASAVPSPAGPAASCSSARRGPSLAASWRR